MYNFLQTHLKLCHPYRKYVTRLQDRNALCKARTFHARFLNNWHSAAGQPTQRPLGRLTEFEGYWMIKLQTLEPYRMNGNNEYQRIIAKNGLHIMFEI